MRRLALIGLVAAAVVFSAAFTVPGGAPPSSRVSVGAGITIELPQHWQRVRGRLSDIVSPIARLAIASFPVRLSKRECECGFPNVVDFPRRGAFLFVWEYFNTSLNTFPPRLAKFRLTRHTAQRFECQGPSDSFYFRIGARTFEADVYLGAGAGPRVRRRLLAALDSLRALRS